MSGLHYPAIIRGVDGMLGKSIVKEYHPPVRKTSKSRRLQSAARHMGIMKAVRRAGAMEP